MRKSTFVVYYSIVLLIVLCLLSVRPSEARLGEWLYNGGWLTSILQFWDRLMSLFDGRNNTICRTGEQCDDKEEEEEEDNEKVCGGTICQDDEYCCNRSCGICAPIDGACILKYCDSDTPTADPTSTQQPKNDGNTCQRDSDCHPIYCFTTPCPQPVCIDNTCTMIGTTSSSPSPSSSKEDDLNDKEELCGSILCQDDEYCCNPSCSICAPKETGACIQTYCDSTPTTTDPDEDDNDDTCRKDSDCHPINCITTPCPQSICVDNRCSILFPPTTSTTSSSSSEEKEAEKVTNDGD
jgi:hypothetical protein